MIDEDKNKDDEMVTLEEARKRLDIIMDNILLEEIEVVETDNQDK